MEQLARPPLALVLVHLVACTTRADNDHAAASLDSTIAAALLAVERTPEEREAAHQVQPPGPANDMARPAMEPPLPADVAALRARGPAALDALLARHDALPDGPEREHMALLIDAVAAQRYAHVSRLYWYTDLGEAMAAARKSRKPILSLRMLGRLDEDLSCANSRFFRVALYADAELSRFLRDTFVLHWSSERMVPRVTVDFGDGRQLERTIAGNSAHIVLDVRGRPVDIIPGLVAAEHFQRELAIAATQARRVGRMDDERRADALDEYHMARMEHVLETWGEMIREMDVYIPTRESLLEAERLARAKGRLEAPMARLVELGPGVTTLRDAGADDSLFALGQKIATARLDAQSRALVARIGPVDWGREPAPPPGAFRLATVGPNGKVIARDWARDPAPATGVVLEAVIADFERAITADTALNEFGLRPTMRSWFMRNDPPRTLEEASRLLYDRLFATPADDPWLGMGTPGMFTGLPNDGVRVRTSLHAR